MADEMKVTVATVKRWENEDGIPGKAAQEKLISICQKEKIDLAEVVEKSIREQAQEIAKSNPYREILFHGSKSGLKGNISPSSRDRCDFGAGFYMGTEPLQPLTLICDYDESVFYIVSIDENELKKIEIPADIEWAMLIAYHRGKLEEIAGTELYAKYAVTQKACDAIRIERKIPLLWMERQALKKVSGRNRKQGISLANRKSTYWKSLQMNARK